eukprot:1106972-Heterocapsa_arctica.AAC.1
MMEDPSHNTAVLAAIAGASWITQQYELDEGNASVRCKSMAPAVVARHRASRSQGRTGGPKHT